MICPFLPNAITVKNFNRDLAELSASFIILEIKESSRRPIKYRANRPFKKPLDCQTCMRGEQTLKQPFYRLGDI